MQLFLLIFFNNYILFVQKRWKPTTIFSLYWSKKNKKINQKYILIMSDGLNVWSEKTINRKIIELAGEMLCRLKHSKCLNEPIHDMFIKVIC